jgi:uncharacterized membrane protein YphA (DoxX/SURF4 family)
MTTNTLVAFSYDTPGSISDIVGQTPTVLPAEILPQVVVVPVTSVVTVIASVMVCTSSFFEAFALTLTLQNLAATTSVTSPQFIASTYAYGDYFTPTNVTLSVVLPPGTYTLTLTGQMLTIPPTTTYDLEYWYSAVATTTPTGPTPCVPSPACRPASCTRLK